MYVFFFNDTATTEIYTLSLHDALPIFEYIRDFSREAAMLVIATARSDLFEAKPDWRDGRSITHLPVAPLDDTADRKSTRLNSSHANISYAVFCLKKKKHIRCPPIIPLT